MGGDSRLKSQKTEKLSKTRKPDEKKENIFKRKKLIETPCESNIKNMFLRNALSI